MRFKSIYLSQIVLVLCFLFVTSFTFAGDCGSPNFYCADQNTTCSCPEWTFNWGAGTDAGDCRCVLKPATQQPCYHTICPVNYRCVGTGGSAYCVSNGTSTTSSCPVECRANGCGTGFETASGCGPITSTTPNFGCKSNQACCRPKSCTGGGTTTCPWQPYTCPPGTRVSSNPISTECRAFNSACTLGNANVKGSCCSNRIVTHGTCGDWYKCPTPSNPTKLCRDCTPDETECNGWSVTTYACEPLVTATPIITPTKTPTSTPTPTQTPTPSPTPPTNPAVCKSLIARLGGVNITSNLSKIRRGDRVVFLGTITNGGAYLKNMTFQLSKIDGTILETKTVTPSSNSSRSALYSFTFSDYGGFVVKVISFTTQ